MACPFVGVDIQLSFAALQPPEDSYVFSVSFGNAGWGAGSGVQAVSVSNPQNVNAGNIGTWGGDGQWDNSIGWGSAGDWNNSVDDGGWGTWGGGLSGWIAQGWQAPQRVRTRANRKGRGLRRMGAFFPPAPHHTPTATHPLSEGAAGPPYCSPPSGQTWRSYSSHVLPPFVIKTAVLFISLALEIIKNPLCLLRTVMRGNGTRVTRVTPHNFAATIEPTRSRFFTSQKIMGDRKFRPGRENVPIVEMG
ncbi:hypothetical protein B0H13DRAFT_1860256 [Mycena leptocephala]|nr:hypothetical protein B0H13DRAFT_1860256 [Mycena leptocephala]